MVEDKLVVKIARFAHTKERKLVFEESPINCSWEELPGGFRTLYLQDATTLLQALLSDPDTHIIEIDPDAELPDCELFQRVNFDASADAPAYKYDKDWMRVACPLLKAGWVLPKKEG